MDLQQSIKKFTIYNFFKIERNWLFCEFFCLGEELYIQIKNKIKKTLAKRQIYIYNYNVKKQKRKDSLCQEGGNNYGNKSIRKGNKSYRSDK